MQRLEAKIITDDRRIRQQIAMDMQHFEPTIRADSATVSAREEVTVNRALMRALATAAQNVTLNNKRADAKRITEAMNLIAFKSGLRTSDRRVDAAFFQENDAKRADASYFPAELTDRNGGVSRTKAARTEVQAAIPIRTVDPAADSWEKKKITSYDGAATIYDVNTTEVPRVRYDAVAEYAPIVTIAVELSINWLSVLFGTRSELSEEAELLEAARRVIHQTYEKMLIEGVAVAKSLDAIQTAKGIYTEVVPDSEELGGFDFSTIEGGGAEMGKAYAVMRKLLNSAADRSDYRGEPMDTAIVSARWLSKLSLLNNLDVGGHLDGLDVMGAMTNLIQAQAGGIGGIERVRSLFGAAQINRVISAPSLDRYGDANHGAMILMSSQNTPDNVRQVIAMAPGIVRTAEDLHGKKQLYTMRTGLLDISVDPTNFFIAKAKVR